MIKTVLAGLAFVALVTPSFAATSATTVLPAQKAPRVAGYVDLHAGYDGGREDWTYKGLPDGSQEWWGSVVGGAARGVVNLRSNVSLQADLWANTYHATSNYSWGPSDTGVNDFLGAGAHLTWHEADGLQIGALASIGAAPQLWDTGAFANIGLEAARDFGNWRLYGQIGSVQGIAGDALGYADHNLYAMFDATYFASPNLAVSGSLGADTSRANDGYRGTQLRWGAKLEYKPEGSPMTGYVAYQGWAGTDDWSGVGGDRGSFGETVVRVGIRVPLGDRSVRSLHDRVGLVDMNGIYGDFAP